MYARSVTIQVMPAAIDDGIAFIRAEVMPRVADLDGYGGLSLLVDRDAGRCIVTTSWRTVEARDAAFAAMAPVREQAGARFGASIDTALWDVAVMHRAHLTYEGSCARVTWVKGDPANFDRAVDIYRHGVLPAAEQMDGFCSASLLVNYDTGESVGTTTWSSREAMEASRSAADALRTRSSGEAGARITDVEEFELVEAHLHLPEMV